MPEDRQYYDNQHNIMKLYQPPENTGDPARTAIQPPEPEPNSVSEKVGKGWAPNRFITNRNRG